MNPEVTRQPEHPGFDTLGSTNTKGEDFLLLVDGREIGGTYYGDATGIPDGEHWVSWGPAGHSMGHRTREDAEQVQLAAVGLAGQRVVTASEPVPEPVTWEQGLADLAPRERALEAAVVGALPYPAPQPAPPTGLPATATAADWDLAERVSQHMQTHFPDTVAAASWTVARDQRDNTAAVIAGPGSDPTMPGGSYAIHAWRWLCSLRDAGFTAEARTDMEVFGRPDEEAPGGRARWLHVTAWDPSRCVPDRSISGLAAELWRKLGLTPKHYVPLTPGAHPPVDTVTRDGVRPDLAVFAYPADGRMDVAVYEEQTGHPVGVGQVPDWLREIGEAHRAHAAGGLGDWCYREVGG